MSLSISSRRFRIYSIDARNVGGEKVFFFGGGVCCEWTGGREGRKEEKEEEEVGKTIEAQHSTAACSPA